MKNLKIGNLEVTKTNIIVITSCVLAGTLTGLGISAMEENNTNKEVETTTYAPTSIHLTEDNFYYNNLKEDEIEYIKNNIDDVEIDQTYFDEDDNMIAMCIYTNDNGFILNYEDIKATGLLEKYNNMTKQK